MSEPTTTENGSVHPLSRRFAFLDDKGFRSRVTWGLGVLAVGLFVFDFAVERHPYLDMEGVKGFYALWGFVSFAFVVLCGWPLRRLLGRDERYYEEGPDGA